MLFPTFFLFSFTFLKWGEIFTDVFANPIIGDENWNQIIKFLFFSFRLAFFTVLLDLLFGIPLAYLLARKKFIGKSLLEDITTLPLVIPTSGFGFATLITWTTVAGIGGLIGLQRGIIDLNYVIPFLNVPFLILIVHVALTFPYIVRTLEAKLIELNPEFEYASRILGATPLTTFRKTILPLSLPALFSGSVLAFARSLGETGATMVVSGVSTTASIAIVQWQFEFKVATAAFLGFILISLTTLLILPIELYMYRKGGRFTFPRLFPFSRIEKKVLKAERFASKKTPWLKDIFSLAMISLVVIAPILLVLRSVFLFWSNDPFTGKLEGGIIYQLFGPSNYFTALSRATLASAVVAIVSTYLATSIAIPVVYLIKRYRFGRVIRSLLKIPLVVPTSALGLSVLLLWGPNGLGLVNPGVWLIILTHIVFSVPVIAETTISAYEGSSISEYEEVARTLGATSYDTTETISLPILKRGILAGVILSFTHSLGETGATFIVMGRDITVPTLVVNMVEALAIPAALFATIYLIIISLVLLFVFRLVTRG